MAIYNVHAGHCPQGQGAHGAVGLLKESVEDRLVKDEVIKLLKEQGHTVYDCTDDTNCDEDTNLYRIVLKCNEHEVEFDISFHLNSGRNDYVGDDSTGGVEAWNFDERTKAISDRICQRISDELGIRNRGTKYTKNLYVLNNTNSLALLVECCFVDDKDDTDRWDYKKCAKAIVEGILDKNLDLGRKPTPKPISKPVPKPNAKLKPLGKVNVTYMVRTSAGWYDPVKNMNNSDYNGYAGDDGHAITGIAIKVDKGSIRYRAHVKGYGWLPYVTGYNVNDFNNGYAGDGREIDAIEVYFVTPNGYEYQQAHYRVSPMYTNGYYDYQVDDFKRDRMDGYAGEFGYPIDKVQIYIE